jgi:hypothetical protein
VGVVSQKIRMHGLVTPLFAVILQGLDGIV